MVKLLKKLKKMSKMVWVHYLELFAADSRSFQVKTLLSEKLGTLAVRALFIWIDSDKRVRIWK